MLAAMTPTIKPAMRPKKPKVIKPITTPPPTAAIISKKTAIAPSIGNQLKRTTEKKMNDIATDRVNAALVTRFQYRLAITGNTIEPHNAPTKISMDKISSFKLANTTPSAAATTMVTRPTQSIFSGSGLFLAMCLPYTSVITMADRADKSESAVEDKEPITITNNIATIKGGK